VELAGKKALVTGAGVRVGRAVAIALAREGVNIAVHYSSSATGAEETAAIAHSLGVEAVTLKADLASVPEAERLAGEASERLRGLDILVNSAAIFEADDIETVTEDSWDRHFAVNLKTPFFLARAFARQLGGGSGHVVNVADWRAVRPGPRYIAYTLAKSGLLAATHALAAALAPAVQVNAVAPGAILPPPGGDQSYLVRLGETLPLRRHGSPDDVARAVLYLLSSDFVTGETIFVDGGQHL
jgi:pteridine reductase